MLSVKSLHVLLLSLMALLFVASLALAAEKVPKLQTNQAYVEQLLLPGTLQIDDDLSVLSFVLNNLPDAVMVYPSENYYYFNFLHGGVSYSGNLRLDASDRDTGKIHFAYFTTNNDWGGNLRKILKTYSLEEGVKVEAVERLKYRVTFRGRSVLFKLNDLAQVQPPTNIMGTGETYIGPVFDESALQFFLIYNRPVKIFHYVLNQLKMVPDILVPDETRPRIVVAQRSGFAFYQDHLKKRLILIGVYEHNAALNNYFDGPFDQLPDNFIKGDMLKEALIDQSPGRAGTIDRYGKAPDGNRRISISPYLDYLSRDELYGFDDCAQKYKNTPGKYYSCFEAGRLSVE